jgi:hypothetical protein
MSDDGGRVFDLEAAVAQGRAVAAVVFRVLRQWWLKEERRWLLV